MSKQYPGGLITKTPPTPSGPYETSTAAGMWTLNQVAYWTKQGLWPTPGNIAPDPYFNYVTMLLHGNGSASGTTNVLPFNSDASTNAFNVTINGDARSNNFTPFQGNGYYSNYFDGSGDYLALPSNSCLVGANDFTLESWVYVPDRAAEYAIFNSQSNASTAAGSSYGYGINTDGTLYTYFYIGSSTYNIASTGTVPVNAWSHVALVRTGGTISLFINGVRDGTRSDISTSSINAGATNYPPCVGINTIYYAFKGYISNLRLLVGSGGYNATSSTITVPTAPLTAITNTAVLTCQSNRFIDNSTNAFTITKNGDTAVAPAQPFTLPTSVATYGSGYFDGTGDSLTINGGTGASAAADFTYEVWIYPTTLSPTYQQIIHGTSLNGAFGFQLLLNGSTLYIWNNLSHQTAVVANQWSHVAVVRSSNTVRLYLNGVQSTNSISTSSTATIITIGTNGSGGTENFNGYQSNGRFVAGTAVYTSTFTPPTSPLTAIANTALLTEQYNGAGNNNGFKDSSQNNFVVSRFGNTTQGTFTPFGSNWSNYFDGSGDYLTGTSPNLSGTWTVELWWFPTVFSGNQTIISFNNGAGPGINIWSNSSRQLSVDDGNTGQSAFTTTTFTANTWNHLAVVRNGTTTTGYINGVVAGSNSFTPSTTSAFSIGRFNGGSFQYSTGYISNVRVVNGTAVYTSAFTPPTAPLTAITNTSLLTCADNRFIDDSTNAYTVTRNGDVSVQRFSPFSPTSEYSTSTIGGSAYFDGSGDYLTTPDSPAIAFGSGDLTIECWCYSFITTGGADQIILGKYTGSFGSSAFAMGQNNTTLNVTFYTGGSSYFTMTSSVALQGRAWNHIAVTRSGNSWRLFLNGAQVASTTQSVTVISNTTPFYVGGEPYYNQMFTGYISNLRVVKGTALYTAAFTPPTAPLTATANTSILLSSTNAAIYDNSMINDQETVGNAMVSTSVEKYGAGSMYFDGTGDGLQVVGSPNTVFGTGDFTVEFWIYLNASTGSFKKFVEFGTSGACFTIETQSTTNVLTITDLNTTVFVTSSSALSLTTWTHVAATRSGTTLRLFQNGTQVGSATNSTNFANSGNVYIGQSNSGQAINAYMDDLRVTKGVARYTANFTPPTGQFQDR